MNLGWKHLAGQLLNGADLSKASLEEIDILLEEYPYFAGLQFLKAAKLKAMQEDELSGSYAKASLYFPNPHWFSLMLEHSVPAPIASALSPELREMAEVREDPAEALNTLQATNELTANSEVATVDTDVEPALEFPEQVSPTQPDWEQNLAENPVFQQHQVSDEEQVEQEIWHHRAAQADSETSVEEIISDRIEDIGTENILEIESPEILLPEAPSAFTQSEETDIEEHFHITPEPAIEFPAKEAEPIEDPVTNTIPDMEQESGTPPIQEMNKAEDPAVADLGIPFEPLYTIDYFASQGIKIAAEASPKDQLSLKMRSFTDWLRAMKKLHPEKIDKDFNQDQEEQVRVIAESSNAPQIVYTEAMAEVFIKQGKKEKARQVFEKLSLLDPGKSAYFAVRIRELKEN